MITLREEIKIEELDIISYLNNKGVDIVGKYFDYDKKITTKKAAEQVKIMVNLHKILLGYNNESLVRIKSTIGKEIENYKVQIRKLQKQYNNMMNLGIENDFEKLIISDGKILLDQAKHVIDYIYSHNYFGIIERSMNREELCIGRCDGSNLKLDKNIQIGTLKYLSYNLVEEDLYKYIKKIKRRNNYIDEEELIKVFAYESHLSKYSINYLKALCSFPKDTLKVWEKYKNNKKLKTYEEFSKQFKNSMNYETKILI
ncbi:spore coat protein [Clostridium taeniosporum]|uniref:Spore coat protein n=1 Tax=Clostridium taeniosporum TaxID=394958 RepID=A0A1D7XGT5_9CLOT|nr:spore coat protein [Clostridium taeniosporum]AOR22571.1 spore coat protein [Clostridium taeniosporum]